MYKIFFFSWIATALLSISCGPLGTFMIWRGMSSFGNTLSHASLLGLSIAALLHYNVFFTVLSLLIVLTIIIVYIEHFSTLSLDTILGIITYSSLSLGMIILNFIPKKEQFDLTKYLFGNLLTLTTTDLLKIFIITFCINVIIFCFWKSMLSTIINVELAQLNGINIFKIRLILMTLIALLIGIATRLIGALLITAFLVIPPAIVQKFSKSPEQMILFAVCINIFSISIGLLISMLFTLPLSPTVILCETLCFLISILI